MNGKNKGNRFEILISKLLSEWWSGGVDSDLFYKSQNSGARATQRHSSIVSNFPNKNNIIERELYDQFGDISSSDPKTNLFISKFCVEVKHYKDVNIWSLFTESKSGLYSFWQQCKRDSEICKKHPFMVVRQNFKPILLAIDFETSSLLQKFNIIDFVHCIKFQMSLCIFNQFLSIDSKEFSKYLETNIL